MDVNLSVISWALLGVAAMAGGLINALAGGGTLVTFPVLTLLGVPPVVAGVTNTVAMAPGYFGGALAQRKELAGARSRVLLLVPVAAAGGLLGGLLLLVAGENTFKALIPWLLLVATTLMLAQDWLKKRLFARGHAPGHEGKPVPVWPGAVGVFAVSVYGGFFLAGLSVIVLAVLAVAFDDPFKRSNALKQVVSLTVSLAAASYFAFTGMINWQLAAFMAVFTWLGGWLGGKLVGKIPVKLLFWTAVTAGAVSTVYYFWKG
jgi:uncharacterized membrane protein YfcA